MEAELFSNEHINLTSNSSTVHKCVYKAQSFINKSELLVYCMQHFNVKHCNCTLIIVFYIQFRLIVLGCTVARNLNKERATVGVIMLSHTQITHLGWDFDCLVSVGRRHV